MYFCYPEFWGKYDGNRRNKLIRESIFIRWNNIFFCKKIFCWAALKSLKTIALHTKKVKWELPYCIWIAKSARIAKTIGHCRSIKSRSNKCRSNDIIPYTHVYWWCVWVLYTCILMVYMGAIYMYIYCAYGCYIHVYWLCVWVLCTCILMVYMAFTIHA